MRCDWANNVEDFYQKYHDLEWGKPVHDDKRLFEMLILEGAQAGLSWTTILKKRENYRNAFDNFDFWKVSKYDNKKIEKLMNNDGIIRNKLKINSVIENAKVFLKIREEFGSFDKYIWGFVNGEQIDNKYKITKDIPSKSDISKIISNDLKKRGMSFVGPTIIYSFMQAIGMVNDHITSCFYRIIV